MQHNHDVVAWNKRLLLAHSHRFGLLRSRCRWAPSHASLVYFQTRILGYNNKVSSYDRYFFTLIFGTSDIGSAIITRFQLDPCMTWISCIANDYCTSRLHITFITFIKSVTIQIVHKELSTSMLNCSIIIPLVKHYLGVEAGCNIPVLLSEV